MKLFKQALAAAALVATVSAASAADLSRPVYKSQPMAVAAYNWSGFYAGLHAGYGWGDANASLLGTSSSGDIDGFFGGGQLGWNWQAPGSPWVWGIEADISFSNIGDSSTVFGVTSESEAKMFGTARVRLGYAVDRALWYVTGGIAWADNELSIRAPALGINVSSSNTHTGWALGGGLEWALADMWTAKVEYLYLSFDSENYFTSLLGTPVTVDADIHTVKFGLNYRFGGGKGPVVAKY